MSVSELYAILAGGGVLIGIVNTLAIIVERWQRPSAAKVEKLVCDVDALDSRTQALESDIKHLPSKDAVNQLIIQVTQIGGRIETSDTRLTALREAMRRVEDILLKKDQS